MQEPNSFKLSVNGTAILLHEWRAEKQASAATILLLHAAGFHGRCWDKTVHRLCDHHVLAWDMRGHGGSDKNGPYDWDVFLHDLIAIIDKLAIADMIGVGHSIGGWCVANTCASRPGAFSRLLLIDPVIMPPDRYLAAQKQQEFAPSEHPVAKRRNQWQSWQQMYSSLKKRMPFKAWHPEILQSYCYHGLQPDADNGGYKLACPPEVEASIYTASMRRSIHEKIAGITVPVRVMRAKLRDFDQATMDFSQSPTWPELANSFAQGEDVYLPNLSHFMPMEAPELIIKNILNA